MPGAPAGVDQFPFTVVDAHSVPGVVGVERWYRLAGLEWYVAETQAISRDHESLQAGLEREGSEQSSISFAYSQTIRDRLFRC
jgi:hypothetical protein